jgi:hypothetical protein
MSDEPETSWTRSCDGVNWSVSLAWMAVSPSESSLFPPEDGGGGGLNESARLGTANTRRRRTSTESIAIKGNAIPVVSTFSARLRSVAMVVVGLSDHHGAATTRVVTARRRSMAPRILRSCIRCRCRGRRHSAHRVGAQHHRMATHHGNSPPSVSGSVGVRIRQVQIHTRIQAVSSSRDAREPPSPLTRRHTHRSSV